MLVVEYVNHKVFAYGTENPLELEKVPSAVTIGSFDGVHVGHRRIISRMLSVAQQRSLRSVVITFEPHPRKVLKKETSGFFGLLTTLDEKINLLREQQIDLLVIVRFTRDFAARSSEDFICNVLVRLIGAKNIVVGYDHGFGSNRSGSGKTLEHLGEELGFEVEVIDEVRIGQEHFSSTRIRRLLEAGMITEANEFLGSPYIISGTVIDGDKRGREIGFPTVNIRLSDPDKLLPRAGVYAARTAVEGISRMAMMNIGYRPTVCSENIKTIEAYILGYSGNLYGCFLQFFLAGFIREEKKFENIDDLKDQLEKDKKTVESYYL